MTRTLSSIVLACALALVGCGGDAPTKPDLASPEPVASADLAVADDLAGARAAPHDLLAARDLLPDDLEPSRDLESGLLPLCAACTHDAQCASGLCAQYGNGLKRCSHPCAPATASMDCPGVDACNKQGLCKCQ